MIASNILLIILCIFAALLVTMQIVYYIKDSKSVSPLTKEELEETLKELYHESKHNKLRE